MSTRVSRRKLLQKTAALAGAGVAMPAIVPARALGKEEVAPASERLTLGLIGCGSLGSSGHHLGRFLGPLAKQVEVLAVCDVDLPRRAAAKKKVDARYGNDHCKEYLDFRELLDRSDIDAAVVVTVDHWHALCAIAAAEAGKDIYCEKPLSLTIEEGRAMVQAVRRYDRVFQTGSQQRSDGRFRLACEAVRNGRIGKLQRIEARIGGGPVCDFEPPSKPPAGLDWNFWLGQTRKVPYQKNRCHYQFRWIYDYSGGKMTDWGAHHNDIAQWGNGTELTGPVHIEGEAEFPTHGIWDTATRFHVRATYANGVVLHTVSDGENGVRFEGSDGWVFVSRGTIRASDDAIINDPFGPGDLRLYRSDNHHQNWLDCIKSRERPICDVEIGHRSATVCHLENIAIRTGRALTWDPAKEQIVGDEAANRWLSRPMRAPWHL